MSNPDKTSDVRADDGATHYRVTLSYDGSEYFGWQRLKNKPTIQGAVEEAIQHAFSERLAVQGAGRTDRGAHAEGQRAGFALSQSVAPADLVARLSEALPAGIQVRDADIVPATFHVRTDAIGKDYEYRMANRPELAGRVWLTATDLDLGAMQTAVGALVGTHDYASFATKPRFKQASTVCTLTDVSVIQEESADGGPGTILFRFSGNRFLMHMVRNMVRAVVKIGEGRHEPESLASVLDAKRRDASPGSAPASGLFLMKVHYRQSL